MKIKTLLMAFALIPSVAMAQQNFSCAWGDQGACLGYGETICSSSGKCVSADAACFNSYQCDYEGFTCKSNLTECVDDYDALRTRFNALVGDCNDLLEDGRGVRAALQRTLEDLDEAQDALAHTQSQLILTREDLEDARDELGAAQRGLQRSEEAHLDLFSCVESLSRFDDPSTCLP